LFAAWGRLVYRLRWLVLVVSVLSIVALIFSMQYGGRLGTGEFSAPYDLVREVRGNIPRSGARCSSAVGRPSTYT
jgi:hypothetical protein